MNIGKEIVKAQAWLQLFPLIVGFVRSIETMMPEEGQGTAKIGMLRIALSNAYEGFGNILGTLDEIWPRVQVMVTSLVDLFNKTGLFNKTKKAP